jgi:hypothetical protein
MSCTVYDSSLLAVSEDISRDSEHSGVSPDGSSGQSLEPMIGTAVDAGGVPAVANDSTGAVLVTIDGAIVESDPDSGMPTDSRDADSRIEIDARPPSVGEEIIDDMEDGDGDIRSTAGRRGAWFILNDGTAAAEQTPAGIFTMSAIPGGRGASQFAARTTGHGFKVWSPLFGFWMNKLAAGLKQPYDARKYAGISFWARTNAATPLAVRVLVPNADTDPDGKTCGDSGSGGCSDHFGKNFAATSQWVKHVIRFSDLAQAGWGHKVDSFDPKTAYGVEFQFDVGTEFDCWIDDVSFLLQ